jgi:hypothetical protein
MITVNGIELDNDLLWVDRFNYSTYASSTNRALDGSLLVVQSRINNFYRPMTLVGSVSSGWLKKSTVEQLVSLFNSGYLEFEVNYNGDIFLCVFDRSKGAPEFNRVVSTYDEFWYGTLNFLIK